MPDQMSVSDGSKYSVSFKDAVRLIRHAARYDRAVRRVVRYWNSGRLSDLTGAITVLRKALEEAADYDPLCMRLTYLVNLTAALRSLYGATGDVSFLVEAVQLGREAVTVDPHDSHHCAALRELSGALRQMAGITGEMSLLEEAVQFGREAVAVAPKSGFGIERALSLEGLTRALTPLYEYRVDVNLLKEAAQLGREAAIAGSRLDWGSQVEILNTLVVALSGLALVTSGTERVDLLTEVVQISRRSVNLSGRHKERSERLCALGISLSLLYAQTGELSLLSEAEKCLRSSLSFTPAGYRNRHYSMQSLGIVLAIRGSETRNSCASAEALDLFRLVGEDAAVPVPKRIVAWVNYVSWAGVEGDSVAAAEAAVELLSQATPGWLARESQEFQLAQISPDGSLAGLLAAAAINAGRLAKAVELLEQSRGILVAESMGVNNGNLVSLRMARPELAREFEELGTLLNSSENIVFFERDPSGFKSRQSIDKRIEAQASWGKLLNQIRSVDGFEKFLVGPSAEDLAIHACDGPIVLPLTSADRCDALILLNDANNPVRLVPLVNLTEATANEQAGRLLEASNDANNPFTSPAKRIAAQREVLEILAWIWDSITEPVLSFLGYTDTPAPGEEWPRIWWSPTGVLNVLPLHAAGHHGDLNSGNSSLTVNPRTVMDRVISSYAPTIQSLARGRTRGPDPDNPNIVVISASGTSPVRSLSSTEAESISIFKYLPEAARMRNPSRNNVLDSLSKYQAVHFDCHGFSNWKNPSGSFLMLDDHPDAYLTVGDVRSLCLSGKLAFLSACETHVNSTRLLDESIHMASAFNLAGYEHVIGTMWQINSELSRGLIEDFYSSLTFGGIFPIQAERSAQALNRATRTLRDQYPLAATLWAAYTHIGT